MGSYSHPLARHGSEVPPHHVAQHPWNLWREGNGTVSIAQTNVNPYQALRSKFPQPKVLTKTGAQKLSKRMISNLRSFAASLTKIVAEKRLEFGWTRIEIIEHFIIDIRRFLLIDVWILRC